MSDVTIATVAARRTATCPATQLLAKEVRRRRTFASILLLVSYFASVHFYQSAVEYVSRGQAHSSS